MNATVSSMLSGAYEWLGPWRTPVIAFTVISCALPLLFKTFRQRIWAAIQGAAEGATGQSIGTIITVNTWTTGSPVSSLNDLVKDAARDVTSRALCGDRVAAAATAAAHSVVCWSR